MKSRVRLPGDIISRLRLHQQLLYLCDNQSLLKAVNRWKRPWIAAGTATSLVKVKSHRGEPANEGADVLANNSISDPKVGKEWCQQSNRAVFTLEKPCREAGKVTYQDHHSTYNNSMRDAIRRGAAENNVQKHEERLTGALRQMSTLRRQYEKWCKADDIEDCTHKQRCEASRDNVVYWKTNRKIINDLQCN